MRLLIMLDKPQALELFNASLTSQKPRSELAEKWTGELTTPAGFTLDVWVQCDLSTDNGAIEIRSAGTLLLQAGSLRADFQTILLLPTEEQMVVSVLRS